MRYSAAIKLFLLIALLIIPGLCWWVFWALPSTSEPSAISEETIIPASHLSAAELMTPEGPFMVHIPAEFDPVQSVIMANTGEDLILTDLLKALLPIVRVTLLEHETSLESLEKNLENTVISLSDPNLTRIPAPLDSFWTRDFGPMVVEKRGKPTIIDFPYENGSVSRHHDDLIPSLLGEQWDIPITKAPFNLLLGNFMTDGAGTCIFSDSLYTLAGSGNTRESVDDFLKQSGCSSILTVPRLSGESSTHIDMYAKLMSRDTVLVGQMDSDDSNVQILDEIAAQFETWGYRVVRVPFPDRWLTYTNSLLVNGHAFIPSYGDGRPELKAVDEEVSEIYRNLGYVPHLIPSSAVIQRGGSVHCVTMQVPPL